MTHEVLLFDLFGTLVFFDDSRLPVVELGGRLLPMTVRDLPALLAELLPGLETGDFLRELRRVSIEVADEKRRAGIELNSSVRFERTLRGFGLQATVAASAAREMADRHMDALARAVVCPPGRVELLRELGRQRRLGLLSNFDCGRTAKRVLDEAGLTPHFERIFISDDLGLRKPNGEIFRRACAGLAVRPADCLYIGDTLLEDIDGATGAGLDAVWIHGDPGAESKARGVLADVGELPAWLSARGAASP